MQELNCIRHSSQYNGKIMSGGHFDYAQHSMREFCDTLEKDIAKAMMPKPRKVGYDYWTVYQVDTPHSCHYLCMNSSFSSCEEAKGFLMSRDRTASPSSKEKHGIGSIIGDGDIVFESGKHRMTGTGDKDIPVLYAIRHAQYEDYPEGTYVLEFSQDTIERMKEAYRKVREASVYAERMDYLLSGDDGEEDYAERLKEDLKDLKKELKEKDWANPYEGWNED